MAICFLYKNERFLLPNVSVILSTATKISPQAILALKEALTVIFWKKEELQDFIKLAITQQTILGTINWTGTKREAVKELIDRMMSRPDIYQDDVMSLLFSVSDMDDFSHLKFWDEDGSKTRKAREAVKRVRSQTSGHVQITKEQEEAKKRKVETEKRILKNKSFSEELLAFKTRFNDITLDKDVQRRGFALEKSLYDLFLLYELEPKGSFKIYGEQIDGAFTLNGTDFLLEAKWKHAVGRGELAAFCSKVDERLKTTLGLVVSIGGVTAEAVSPYFKSIIIMDGLDVITILDGRVSLPDLLLKKRRRASETGEIYVNFNQL